MTRGSSAKRPLGRGGLQVGHHAVGLAPIGNSGGSVSDADAAAALDAAWQAGIRYFDTAPHYGLGLAERRLGDFLQTKRRDEFVVSTKVGRLLVGDPRGWHADDEGFAVSSSLTRRRDYSADGVLRSLDGSLERLRLDRVDVLFVHDCDDFYEEALRGAFPALERLRGEGVITSYGVGMNRADMLADLIRDTDSDVMMCAGRYSLLDQSALVDALPAASARGVSMVAAAPFNSGLLAHDRPSAGYTYDYAPATAALLDRARAIAAVCSSHGVPLPAAALQFALGHPAVATVCTGIRSAEELQRNAALFDEEIPAALWSELIAAGFLPADVPLVTAEGDG